MEIAYGLFLLLVGIVGLYRAHRRRPKGAINDDNTPSFTNVVYVSSWGGVLGGILIILVSTITGK